MHYGEGIPNAIADEMAACVECKADVLASDRAGLIVSAANKKRKMREEMHMLEARNV